MAAKVKKWENGIDPMVTTTTEDDVKEYLETKLWEYNTNNIKDYTLWEAFQDDFSLFNTIEAWEKMQKRDRRRLRAYLRCGGVYVEENTRHITTAQTLLKVVQEETRHPWDDDEIVEDGQIRDDLTIGPITSINVSLEGYRQRLPVRPANQAQNTPQPQTPPVQTHNLPPNTPLNAPPNGPSLTPYSGLPLNLHAGPPPANAPPTTSYARIVGEVAKMYNEDMKYSGHNSSFRNKRTIFEDVCQRADLPPNQYMRAFPIMLKGLALDYYYNTGLSKLSYLETCEKLRTFFEPPEYYRANLNKWNSITLNTVAASHPDKTIGEAVQLLVNELTELQHGLEEDLRKPAFFLNKIVTACQGIPACRYAVSSSPTDLGQLLNNLQSSITAYEKEQEQPQNDGTAYFTDRRFHSRNQPDRQRGGRQHSSGRDYASPVRHFKPNYDRSTPRSCFICKKPDCRSWKHTPEEQDAEKARFRARNISRFSNKTRSSRDFDNRFTAAYLQHVANAEGETNGDASEDELGEEFEVLLADADVENLDVEPPVKGTTWFTTVGGLLTAPATLTGTANTLVDDLTSLSLLHRLTGETRTLTPGEALIEDTFAFTAEATSRYDSSRFYGVVIDTGASKYSTAGFGQFQALQRTNRDVILDETTKGRVTVQFGIGSTSSIGSAIVKTPIGQVEFHIMVAKTPFLLSLANMDKLGVYFNNLKNELVTSTGTVPVVRRFGHPFLLWDTSLHHFIVESFSHDPCYLSEVELRRLHRRFGHPSVGKLQNVLERAGHDVDRETLEYLTKYCEKCQKHGRSPGRFKFNLRDDVNFNYSVIVDIFYINGKPVLHVVDEGTRYQAGQWLQNISATHTWDTLRQCWIDTYLGPPDQLITDAGKQFTSKEFSQHAGTMGIKVKIVPVEAHNSVGIVERYHGPVRRAYLVISTEIQGISKDMALQMAFKAVNDTAGPDGLVPTLLVYGALPRMVEYDAPSPSVAQRSAALKKAMSEIQKLRAKRLVTEALSARNGPSTTDIHDLALNSDVLVWREGNTGQPGSWEGPYKLVAVNDENCVLELPRGNTTFRSTSVKPFYVPDAEPVDTEHHEPERDAETDDTIVVDTSRPTDAPKRGRGRPRKAPDVSIFLQDTVFLQDELQYEQSRQTEITGLLQKGVFEITPRRRILAGTRIFNSRFVDEVKHKGTEQELMKSRLVVQAYNDDSKHAVLTQSPTIQRISQRVILSVAAMTSKTTGLFLRDISQAYVQSTTLLNRDFYVNPPRELAERLNLTDDSVLKVVKPLYGVPEAGNHWFKTYHSHHTNELAMEQSTYDPCLLYSNQPFGVVGLQTDDTLFVGDDDFAVKEQLGLEKAGFLAKEREQLTTDHDLKFNGGIIHVDDAGITLTQVRQCKNLETVSENNTTTTSIRGAVRQDLSIKDQYVAQRARGAYIASVCQPEAAYDLSVAAQAVEPTKNDVTNLNKRIRWQIENSARGLRFVTLDKTSLRLLAFTDASFANNRDLSSQIGYVLVLADASGRANILHWSSTKCKRVTRSVLASELYGMAHGFDMGASVKSTIDRILGTDVNLFQLPLVICTDSKSLYECLVKLGTTQEKRLMIDVMCLRQAYERREIAEVKWIKGDTNPADAMTKSKPSNALKNLIETNTIRLDVEEWVERE
jgi:hypothetical protein